MKERKINIIKKNGEQINLTFIYDSNEVYIKEYNGSVNIHAVRNPENKKEISNFIFDNYECLIKEFTKEDIIKEIEKTTKKEDLKNDEFYLKLSEEVKHNQEFELYF